MNVEGTYVTKLNEEKRKVGVETFIANLKSLQNDSISAPQRDLIEAVTTLAANEGYALDQQLDHIQKAFLDDVIEDLKSPEEIYAGIKQKLEVGSNKLLFQENEGNFGAEDRKPLYERTDKERAWLTNEYVSELMPKDDPDKGFIVLAPVQINQLSALTVRDILENNRSIIIPVGPGHWRAISIEKLPEKKDLSITLFDSFGFGSDRARKVGEEIIDKLSLENAVVNFAEPKSKQRDGYSCGDFVIAYAHTQAKKYDVAYELAFVDALEKGSQLRPLMIEKVTPQNFFALTEGSNLSDESDFDENDYTLVSLSDQPDEVVEVPHAELAIIEEDEVLSTPDPKKAVAALFNYYVARLMVWPNDNLIMKELDADLKSIAKKFDVDTRNKLSHGFSFFEPKREPDYVALNVSIVSNNEIKEVGTVKFKEQVIENKLVSKVIELPPELQDNATTVKYRPAIQQMVMSMVDGFQKNPKRDKRKKLAITKAWCPEVVKEVMLYCHAKGIPFENKTGHFSNVSEKDLAAEIDERKKALETFDLDHRATLGLRPH